METRSRSQLLMDRSTLPTSTFDYLSNKFGELFKTVTVPITGSTGGLTDEVICKQGYITNADIYLTAIQFSVAFLTNQSLNRYFGVGPGVNVNQKIGCAGGNIAIPNLFFLVISRINATTITQTGPVTKSGVINFYLPFLPLIRQGCRISPYVSDDLGAGEQICGTFTVHYVPKFDK